MKDSRLQQALAALDDARTTLSDILEETRHNSEDHAYLHQAYKSNERAIRHIQKAQGSNDEWTVMSAEARDIIAQVLRSAGVLLPNDYTPAWSYDRKLDELAAEIDTALATEVGELRRLRATVLRLAEAYEQSAAELPTPHGAATEAFKIAARDIRVALFEPVAVPDA